MGSTARVPHAMTLDELKQRIDLWEDGGRFDMLELLEDLVETPAATVAQLDEARWRNALTLFRTAGEIPGILP